MVLTLLNYQSPRYRGLQNKPDSVTQQIIGWQSVWGFFDIPRNKGGKFLNNLWFCVFQIGTHNPRGINEPFSFNKFILVFSSRKAKARTSAFELFTMDNLRCQLGWEYLLILFRYSYWFLGKSILKLDNWKYFCCFHARGRYKKNISDFLKASHNLWFDISRTFWPIFMKIQEIYKRHKFI